MSDPNNDVSCPFCGETGFDLVGLKSHLVNGDCAQWNETQTPERLF